MKLTRLAMIEPLGLQIGVWPKRCVPQSLQDLLFGDMPEHDLPDQNARPRGLWAVLDAARLPNLPEELEASGLPHRCLFRGKAQQDWGHVAPWLVALNPDARLTRRLFTAKAPFGLWLSSAAMFLSSRAEMDDLWRHFRKFTRIQDVSGAWLYFRFWEAQSVQMLYKSAVSLPDARRFFQPCDLVLAPLPDRDECLLVEPRVPDSSVQAPTTSDDARLSPATASPFALEPFPLAPAASDVVQADAQISTAAGYQATSARDSLATTVPPVSVGSKLPPLLLQRPLDDLREAAL